jgi:hypothetical protein
MRGAAKKERKNERGSSRPPLQRKKNFFTPTNKVNKSNQKIIRSIQ